MSQSGLFVLLITASSLTYASACSCLAATPQDHFCRSQFASVFKVKDNGTRIGWERVYNVELLHQYRTIVPEKNPDAGKLYTMEGGSLCGVNFIADRYYVVTGYYRRRPRQVTQMWTNFCFMVLYYKENPLETFVQPPCKETRPGQAGSGIYLLGKKLVSSSR